MTTSVTGDEDPRDGGGRREDWNKPYHAYDSWLVSERH